jgi:hypothetical protein
MEQAFEIRTDRADADLHPDLLYSNWEIESTKDELEDRAREIGEQVSQGNIARGRGPAPNAYKACTSWHAIEIIEQLQLALKRAEDELQKFKT